ncbi:hypothetical protein [Microbacterium sp. ZXX196]|uniref:hypothetical protein n=1 Tax=Microbacterium sp. ZXX196 TaxID=2609291 RepID=UPI0012B826DC|nr:hypothetical protein [Microbacterium sp. ZXX196]MTE24203.1 hypothetical protein [Microbacterium sp. ZXX196]
MSKKGKKGKKAKRADAEAAAKKARKKAKKRDAPSPDGADTKKRGGSASKKKHKAKAKKRTPKKKCCASKPRCTRCPIRMLKEGRLDPADAKVLFANARNRSQLEREAASRP